MELSLFLLVVIMLIAPVLTLLSFLWATTNHDRYTKHIMYTVFRYKYVIFDFNVFPLFLHLVIVFNTFTNPKSLLFLIFWFLISIVQIIYTVYIYKNSKEQTTEFFNKSIGLLEKHKITELNLLIKETLTLQYNYVLKKIVLIPFTSFLLLLLYFFLPA
jgi:hypothetical protein